MQSVIALFQLIPAAMISLSLLALSGIYATYRLAKLRDRYGRRSLALILVSAALVPLVAYVANNYWISIHSSAERLALQPIPMNHAHLEAMYFVWWCGMSVLAWVLYAFSRTRAA